MRRRDFITLLGSAAAWPLAARAQQPARMRRIGVLMNVAVHDPEAQATIAQLRQGLRELGWIEGRNVTIDYRLGAAGNADLQRRYVAELVALGPDVIVAGSAGTASRLHQANGSLPIVIAGGPDPVGSGLVKSLAQPGGNITGFFDIEDSLAGKLVELLKQVAPRVIRAGVIRNPGAAPVAGSVRVIQAAAASAALDVRLIDSQNPDDIERGVAAFASVPNGGLVVPGSALALVNRELIIKLAGQYRLPAVYQDRLFVAGGGLISYGPVLSDTLRRAAGYVDRILRGEKPADLPVQAPTKFEMVINLKTAKAIGLAISESFLARADEVIE
jgi:putative ABC transport system substrate-binding protein